MAAIDWLLNWSPNSERMHQVVLAGLFQHTALLRKLDIEGNPAQGLETETQGRLFDFTVPLETGRKVQIELKLDANMGEDQICRQIASVKDNNDILLYVLLGITQFRWPPAKIEALLAEQGVGQRSKDVRVVDLCRMLSAVNSLAAETRDPDQRDLAVAYGSLLRRIHESHVAFSAKTLNEWEWADWFGFYDKLRTKLQIRCEMDYVPNQSGGFVGCWWGNLTRPTDDCGFYLQLEGDKLCFKVSICNRHKTSASVIRNRFSDAVLAATTGLNVKKPSHFGKGTWMTAAVFGGDYRAPAGKDKLDWEYTANVLAAAEKILKTAVHRYSVS
jgi:hypothetical protein